jgi:Ni,Fe-hydrogenase III large subunit
VYLFTAGLPDRRVELQLITNTKQPEVPTLASVSFPASRFEREMQDMFGVKPLGHPHPGRLVLHQHWPDDWFPMRRGAGATPQLDPETRPFPFTPVEGSGVYEIPVGPVHAGMIEPGHFRFSVVGETVLSLKARLWFVHRGVERLFEGRNPEDGIVLTERISGDTAVGHSWAYAQAIESASGIDLPFEANVLRAILLELERIYNHVSDIGGLANDVGFGIVNAHTNRIRERMLRMNKRVTGHRLLRDAITGGGVSLLALPDLSELQEIESEVSEIVEMAFAQNTLVDRFVGTSVLSPQEAADIGTLGYVARASGQPFDARQSHPIQPGIYEELTVPVLSDGDVMARAQIRVQEFSASMRLLSDLLERAGSSGLEWQTGRSMGMNGSGVGIVEGWRGTIVHRVEITDGQISRVKVVDPSFMNWPALHIAMAETIVPDFPLTNKSFNQSYAGNDL